MSARSHDIDARNARTLRHIERAGLQPPDAGDADPVAQFDSLSLNDQRSTIRDHMRRWNCDRGLFGEAVNESRLNAQIESAFYANDIDQLGKLVDLALRSYIGNIIQRHWESDDE